MLCKIDIKKKRKNTTLKGHISKTRTNLESRLRFSESLFNFLENSIVFLRALPSWVHGSELRPSKPHPRCQWLAGLKWLNNKVIRTSRSQSFFLQNGVLKSFTIITGKHLCWTLFFNKVVVLRGAGAFFWTLRSFLKQLFYRAPSVTASKVFKWWIPEFRT